MDSPILVTWIGIYRVDVGIAVIPDHISKIDFSGSRSTVLEMERKPVHEVGEGG
jgi:hypothetical protein